MRTLAITLTVLVGLAATAPAQTVYDIDPSHSSAQFGVRHLMISTVRGEFSKVTGTIAYDPKNLAGTKIHAVIDATTINTRNAKRDAHLQSADFFETAKYPTIQFQSKEVTQGNGGLQVKGDLTMHGVTKEVILAVEGPVEQPGSQGGKFGASATTKINRKDWGLTWNRALEAGGVTVGDEVTITIDLEAVRRKAAPATN